MARGIKGSLESMLQQLIDQYGYLALFIGTFMEGETIYVLAMLAAKLGYLDPVTTMLVGFVGTLAGDQFFFFLGRLKGRDVLRKRPTWRLRIRYIDRLLRRRPYAVMLGYRFLYGIRAITPFAIGLSGIPIRKFFFLNVAGAALWAFIIGVLTLMFGELLEKYLGNLKRYEFMLFGILIAIGLTIWLVMRIRRNRRMAAEAKLKDEADTES